MEKTKTIILNKSGAKMKSVHLHLFDNVVKPIALYSCEIWDKKGKLEETWAQFAKH